ncbi:hypothetical protein L202_07405 [Cryptococcus amylolentus CBS 6039]|uniref:Nucleoporin Nup54 alpha-helical domain-containing protein n=1 Tax=Cryptococcus amylolentus CBS 6039 TaxID=1295533 RepID=A0A1E3HC16_9TREE|nr:hypothetical protein L202_07405 [Cryptococcus amylolentus CBS 6039]ODN73888.1 hypothetical protein L202_07405 [Cryptococcus amylolentus CBS 6039]
MSFGNFSFGNKPAAAPAPAAPAATSPFSFGNTSTQPAAPSSSSGGGLFGNTSQSQQPPQQQPAAGGSSLFGSFGAKPAAPAAGAPAAGGLFGSLGAGQQQQQQQQQPATGGGLFGSTTQPQQQQQSGGLFGSTANQQPQQQAGGGLFGSTGGQQAGQQAGSGLFGSTAQKPASGLFGSTTQPAQQSTGSGLFGSTSQPAQHNTGGGLFGSTTQPQQSGGTGLFGSTSQPPKPAGSLFGNQPGGTSLFGQTTQPAQNQQQLQTSTNGTSGSGGIEKTAKFSDLPEAAQKYIEQLDASIKNQKSVATLLNTEPLGLAIWQTGLDVKTATEDYGSISHTLKSLKNSISQLHEKMIDQSRDVERLKEIWEIYSSGDARMAQVKLAAYKEFPQEFFSKVADQMEEKAARYKKTIAQLNRAIVSLSSESHAPSPQAIAQTINNHQQAILALAGQLDQMQVRMNGLKQTFAAEWRDKTGSVRDPFEMAREERGVKA